MTKLNFTQLTLIGFVALSIFTQFSCKKEKTSWDTQLKAPIAETELKITNLLASDIIETNPDNSLKIVFENDLANIVLTDVFNLPNEIIQFGSSLQTLKFSNDSTTLRTTLGELGRSAGYGGTLEAAHTLGLNVTIPALADFPDSETNIDNTSLFQTVDVKTGTIVVTITDSLPVDINDLRIDLYNSPVTPANLLGWTTFPLIKSGETESNEVKLDGLVVSSSVVAVLSGYHTSASDGAVKIDTTDALIYQVKIKDIIPNSATAIWPDQNLIDTTSLAFLAQNNGAMIKGMTVKEGTVDIDVFSNLQDSMFFSYSVPNLIKSGQTFVANVAIGPAPIGGYSSKKASFSFAGYEFRLNGYGIEAAYGGDLNGNNSVGEIDTVNTYVQNVKVRMKHTGIMVPIALSDTVFVKAVVGNVVPQYVEGYMGKDTIDIGPSTSTLDFFANHLSGNLKLEDAKLAIVVDNGIGAEAKFKIESLSGTSSVNSSTVNLSGTGVTSPHNLGAATKTGGDPAVNIVNTSINLDNSNSNAANFLENLPNSINYTLKAMLNGDLAVPTVAEVVNNPPNFLYDGYGVNAKINVEVPLSMVADNLILVDTLDFSYTEEATEFTQSVFTLAIENGFGFDATINLVLLDASGNKLDTLINNGVIARGVVDPATGKTTESTKSLIHFKVDSDKLALIKQSSKIAAIVKLHSYELTDSNQKYHKMYSNDSFKIKLIGSAIYNVKF